MPIYKQILLNTIVFFGIIVNFSKPQSSASVEEEVAIPDAPRCTSGSCGECLTSPSGEGYCNLCLNGHTLKFNLEYVEPIDLTGFDPYTATCSEKPLIENCKRLNTNHTLASAQIIVSSSSPLYVPPSEPDAITGLVTVSTTSPTCEICAFGYFRSRSGSECISLSKLSNFDPKCQRAEFSKTTNRLKCIACDKSIPSLNGRYCIQDIPIVDNCLFGGLEGGIPVCVRCDEGYYLDGQGGCATSRIEGCARYGKNWECLECEGANGWFSVKTKQVIDDTGVVTDIQFCELLSQKKIIFSVFLLFVINLIF